MRFALLIAPLLAAVCQTAGAATFFHFDATKASFPYTPFDYRFEASNMQLREGFEPANAVDFRIGSADFFYYGIVIGAPAFVPLAPGKYDFAFPDGGGLYPTLDFYFHGGNCAGYDQRFVVHDVQYDDTGDLARIAYDFYCGSYGTVVYYGQLRYNSEIPERMISAFAGRDRHVDEAQPVTLDGSNSVGEPAMLASYSWSQLSGPAITFSDPDAALTSFVAPSVEAGGAVAEIQLTVINLLGVEDTDVVRIHIQNEQDPHTLLYEKEMQEVLPLSRALTFLAPESELTVGADTFGARLSATGSGLVEWDGLTRSASGGVQLWFGYRPVVPETIDVGWYVDTKAGAASTLPASRGEYNLPCAETEEFRPRRIAIHEIERGADGAITRLAVDYVTFCNHDGRVENPDFQEVGWIIGERRGAVRFNSNYPLSRNLPYAAAGPDQTVYGGQRTVLNGLYSDSGSDVLEGNTDRIVSYHWTQSSGPAVVLADPNASATSFSAPGSPGVLTFQLQVTDAQGLSNTDTVSVTVRSSSEPRTLLVAKTGVNHNAIRGGSVLVTDADAVFSVNDYNPQEVVIFAEGNADWSLKLGTGDGSPLRNGTFTGGSSVVSFSGIFGCEDSSGTARIHDVVFDAGGRVQSLYAEFEHHCGDPTGSDATRRADGLVLINHGLAGTPPTAGAASPVSVLDGDPLTLDASGSSSPGSEIAGYRWKQLAGPWLDLGSITGLEVGETTPVKVSTPKPLRRDLDRVTFPVQVTVDNTLGFSSSDVVYVTVDRNNVRPAAVADAATMYADQGFGSVNVVANDSDPDGALAPYPMLTVQAKHGYAEQHRTGFRYFPHPGYTGPDQFKYSVQDNCLAWSDDATVSIVVLPAREPEDLEPDGEPSGGGGGSLPVSFLALLGLAVLARRRRTLSDRGSRPGRGAGGRCGTARCCPRSTAAGR